MTVPEHPLGEVDPAPQGTQISVVDYAATQQEKQTGANNVSIQDNSNMPAAIANPPSLTEPFLVDSGESDLVLEFPKTDASLIGSAVLPAVPDFTSTITHSINAPTLASAQDNIKQQPPSQESSAFVAGSTLNDNVRKTQSVNDLQVLPAPPSAPTLASTRTLSTPSLMSNTVVSAQPQPTTQQPPTQLNSDGSQQPGSRPFTPTTMHSPHMPVNPYLQLNHPGPFPHHAPNSAAYLYGRNVLAGPGALNGAQQVYPMHPSLLARQLSSSQLQTQPGQPIPMYARNGVSPQQGASVGDRTDPGHISPTATTAGASVAVAAPHALATPPQLPKQALQQQQTTKTSASDTQKGVKRKKENGVSDTGVAAVVSTDILDQSLNIPSRVTVKINKKQKTDSNEKGAALALPAAMISKTVASTEIALQSPDKALAPVAENGKSATPGDVPGASLPQYDLSVVGIAQPATAATAPASTTGEKKGGSIRKGGAKKGSAKSGAAKSDEVSDNGDEENDEAGRMEDSMINNHANRDSFLAILSKVGLSRDELQKVSTKKLNLLSTRRNLTQWEVLELKTDRRRAKNRAAAALCRMKKKQFLNDMEGNMSQLKGDNRRLMSEFSRLTQEYRELCRHTRNRKEHNGKLFSRVCELRSKLKSFCEGQSPDVSMCIGFSLEAPASTVSKPDATTDTDAKGDAKSPTEAPTATADGIQMNGVCLPPPNVSVALPNPDALALPSAEPRKESRESLTAGEGEGDALRLPDPGFSISSPSLAV